ncbi:MAG: bifunctional 4-hydroxy-2-oxoglutarate aldolase/2-dehydro-3-deoxy-phosphogluconate aldolase [Oscillospiraceae bacterium]|jgi:2-dehydro-3-deoxyphosphogluconate aldolase/(4S)-4-hydroxy-2-oxoglutarate aldolase|nr:bifunctional 4-hydroxy-2-oxoglutarate aldolase/2-dehydro-3-deoxy-phosphogluconate aldolase [Oscillospiraceae bacterium]
MSLEQIKACGLVPVIKIDDAESALPLAQALLDGGINCIEITFRTAAAPEAIRRVAQQVPDMLVGAGTVLTLDQLAAARQAGAKFIVSPGLDPVLVKAALDAGLTILPGVVTPTEIITGLNLGLTVFKFFPAENYGGLKTVKALSAPFGGVRFVPTGGISEKNAADYWKNSSVLAVGGSWMAPPELIAAGHFAEITRRTREAVALLRTARG